MLEGDIPIGLVPETDRAPTNVNNNKKPTIGVKETSSSSKSSCRLHCLVELYEDDAALCNNSRVAAETTELSTNTSLTDNSTATIGWICFII